MTLLLGSALLLLLPWLLGPRGYVPGPRPEVRGYLTALWWINRGYCTAVHGLVNFNEAPLPEHGPAILVANHTSNVNRIARLFVIGFLSDTVNGTGAANDDLILVEKGRT